MEEAEACRHPASPEQRPCGHRDPAQRGCQRGRLIDGWRAKKSLAQAPQYQCVWPSCQTRWVRLGTRRPSAPEGVIRTRGSVPPRVFITHRLCLVFSLLFKIAKNIRDKHKDFNQVLLDVRRSMRRFPRGSVRLLLIRKHDSSLFLTMISGASAGSVVTDTSRNVDAWD